MVDVWLASFIVSASLNLDLWKPGMRTSLLERRRQDIRDAPATATLNVLPATAGPLDPTRVLGGVMLGQRWR
jgi:hypothetical protein